nr:MAG TPA: hypothetical protein [Caudoviricetes sp.]
MSISIRKPEPRKQTSKHKTPPRCFLCGDKRGGFRHVRNSGGAGVCTFW